MIEPVTPGTPILRDRSRLPKSKSKRGSDTRWCRLQGAIAIDIVNRYNPEEASRRPLLFEVEDRLSTTTSGRFNYYKLEEEDRGSTTRPIEDLLEEEYRGTSKKSRTEEGSTTGESNRGRNRPQESKPKTTRTQREDY